MTLNPLNPHAAGRTLYTHVGNTRNTNENMAGSGQNWTFANTPVVRTDINLRGFRGTDEFIISNFTVEPISGTLSLNSTDATGLTSISGSYDNYDILVQIVVDTDGFKPQIEEPQSQTAIGGNQIYSLNNVYPTKLDLDVLLNFDNLAIKNPVSTSIVNAEQYLLIDKVARRAYEGFITSDQFLTVEKGEPVVAPIRVHVQQFGDWDPVSGTIDWEANKN